MGSRALKGQMVPQANKDIVVIQASLAFLVRLGPLAHLDLTEHVDRQERMVLMVTKASLVRLEHQDPKEVQANQDLMAQQEAPEHQVFKDAREKGVEMVTLVIKGHQVTLANKGLQVLLVPQDKLVNEEFGVRTDLKDHVDPLELQDHLDHKDLLGLLDQKVNWETQEKRVTQDGQVCLDSQDQRDLLENLDQEDHQVHLDLGDPMVLEAHWDLTVRMDQRDHQDQQDQEDLLVRMEEGVLKENQVVLEHLAHLDSLCMPLL